jgi:hypothetical protein
LPTPETPLPYALSSAVAADAADPAAPVSSHHSRGVTGGVLLLLVVAGVLRLLARSTGGGWLALASAGAVVVPVVARLMSPHLRGIQVRWAMPDRAAVGEQVPTTLSVRNGSRYPSPPMRMTVSLPGFEPLALAVPSLRAGRAATLTPGWPATARGEHLVGSVVLEAHSPIGLVRTRRALGFQHRLLVHPAPAVPPTVVAGDRSEGAEPTRQDRPIAGRGTEVLGLRAWRVGESARAVSARATARHGRPLVLEREREVSPHRVVLVGGGAGPGWEHQLSVLASFSAREVAHGRELELRGLPQPPGRLTPLRVLDAFARADRVPTLTAAALQDAVRSTPPGAVLVVAPGQADVTALWGGLRSAARARRVQLVIVDAVVDA